MRFRDGDPEAPLKIVGEAPGQARHGSDVPAQPKTFTKTEFDFATLEHRLRELAFLNSGVTIVLADQRGVEKKEVTLHYEGGLEAFVRYLDRAKTSLIPAPDHDPCRTRGMTVEVALDVERQLSREHAVLHQQHPPARRRHASGRLPRRADARGDEIRRRIRPAERKTRSR